MRLLQHNSSGQLSLAEDFVDDNIPEYAILSHIGGAHIWGADAEEVIFRDLMGDTTKSKASYDKIPFCGEQTRRDGLKYFWVDTCCINKWNNTALSRAINSMFR